MGFFKIGGIIHAHVFVTSVPEVLKLFIIHKLQVREEERECVLAPEGKLKLQEDPKSYNLGIIPNVSLSGGMCLFLSINLSIWF